jgi:RNA polymerase sigma-70 factor, ECF subfamily
MDPVEPIELSPDPPADRNRLLVEQIQAESHKESFGQLYALFHARVFRFFLRRRFSECESEELTQDTFMRVYKSIGSFKHDSRFETWLFIVAINVYRNEVRRRKTDRRSAHEASLDDEATQRHAEAGGWLSSAQPGPLDDAQKSEQRRLLAAAVEQGLQYKEIAALMEISIDTVKAHLHQAMERLSADVLAGGAASGARETADDEAPPIGDADGGTAR